MNTDSYISLLEKSDNFLAEKIYKQTTIYPW